MAQKKKDFTNAAAEALGSGDVVSRIISPQPQADTTKPAPYRGRELSAEDRAYIASLSPAKAPLYTNKDGSEVRVTFMLPVELHEKLRRVCFMEDMKKKDAIAEALQLYVEDYEKKNGIL